MASAKPSRWKPGVSRLGGFLKALFRSKMAILGLVILVMFSVVATAAPLITPYDPQNSRVSGALAPPAWLTYLSEGSKLSQNLNVEPNPGFPTAQSLQAWRFESSDSSAVVAYNSTQSYSPGSGSAMISLNRATPKSGTFITTLEKSFFYPYSGPPARFLATVAVRSPTASETEPVAATVFVERLSDHHRWNLTDTTAGPSNLSWSNYPFIETSWIIPKGEGVDSNNPALQQILNTGIPPTNLIFSTKDSVGFAYGIAVTFTSTSTSTAPLVVFVDDLSLNLLGTAWGLLGTDNQGLDVFSQVIYGARVSLLVGLVSAFIGIGLGLLIGLMAGYMGSVVDEVLMRFTDMLLVIPTLPLLIVLVAVLGTTLASGRLFILILLIGFLGWMGFARVVRSQVLTLKERPFVEAAKAAGAGTGHITTRHIFPNIVGLIYVNLALAVPGAILSEAALSFLGLGDTTVMSWGKMLHDIQESGSQHIWWWVIPPGLAIAIISLSFVMIGYALDEMFNPKLRQRR